MYYLLPWTLFAVLYFPIFTQLYTRWQSIDYTYACFILPVSLLLVWRKREALTPGSSSRIGPVIFGLLLLALSLLLYLWGWRQDYLFVSTFSIVPVCLGLVLFFYGQQAAKKLLFPCFYLLLLIPPPMEFLDSITIPLRHGITIAADIFLKLIDVPVVRKGLHLSLGGIHVYPGVPFNPPSSFMALLAIGLIYAHLTPLNLRNKTVLVVAIVPLALIGNFIFITATCLSIYCWGPQMSEGSAHLLTGLAIFLVMAACLISLGKWLEENEYD